MASCCIPTDLERNDCRDRTNQAGGKDYRYDGRGTPKTAFQEDHYILKGGGPESYTPRFTFHGFRYVEVTTENAATPCEVSLEGLRLNSDVAPVGTFECCEPVV